MTKKPPAPAPEIESGAWKRFESAIDVVAKSPPQHKVAKKPKTTTTKRGKK